VDTSGFTVKMEEQRERARADAKAKRAVVSVAELPALRSVFEGYNGLEASGTIATLLRNGEPVDRLEAGEDGQIVIDRTSFYA
ncbi:MAG: alanine--tRNA ligase-related protein, partial [Candidatus Velthaea sp.]